MQLKSLHEDLFPRLRPPLNTLLISLPSQKFKWWKFSHSALCNHTSCMISPSPFPVSNLIIHNLKNLYCCISSCADHHFWNSLTWYRYTIIGLDWQERKETASMSLWEVGHSVEENKGALYVEDAQTLQNRCSLHSTQLRQSRAHIESCRCQSAVLPDWDYQPQSHLKFRVSSWKILTKNSRDF